MNDWRTRLAKLVRVAERVEELPEPLAYFHASPASEGAWPGGLPPNPALRDFYPICDGGRIGSFEILPLAEVHPLIDDAPEAGTVDPGRCHVFGDVEIGFPLVWDGVNDCVGYYDRDSDEFQILSEQKPGMGPTLEGFFAYVLGRPED